MYRKCRAEPVCQAILHGGHSGLAQQDNVLENLEIKIFRVYSLLTFLCSLLRLQFNFVVFGIIDYFEFRISKEAPPI